MMNFFRRLFKKPDGKKNPPRMDMPPAMAKQMLNAVQQTEEVEYSCDDVYRLMDEYVELVRRGEDTSKLMPLVEHHLKMCGDCREEVEALLRMMDSDPQR
jgi:hypothetical protein